MGLQTMATVVLSTDSDRNDPQTSIEVGCNTRLTTNNLPICPERVKSTMRYPRHQTETTSLLPTRLHRQLNDASSVRSNESEYFSAEEFYHGLHCEVEHRV
jgi:hypothetical protein